MGQEDEGAGWIDPKVAIQLVKEYLYSQGLRGGTELSKRIEKYTESAFLIHRRTLEDWFNEREPASHVTRTAVLSFLKTKHFQSIVPRAADYLRADARLHRIGSALYDLHGPIGTPPDEVEDLNVLIAGWWALTNFNGPPPKPPESVIHVEPVSNHPFSKICIYLRSAAPYPMSPPRGSGIVFPQRIEKPVQRKGFPTLTKPPFGSSNEFPNPESRETEFRYAAYLWMGMYFREQRMKVIYINDRHWEAFHLAHRPVETGKLVLEVFGRINESDVPAEIRAMLAEWSLDVVPRE
ncbi:MAG: hypothetical protein QM740_17835 [Acidovorax sp.]